MSKNLEIYSYSKVIFIKYHFSILGWSISHGTYQTETSSGFSPLRYWGSLYLKKGPEKLFFEFQSPLILGQSISQYLLRNLKFIVLVPFDIGVVYIGNGYTNDLSRLFQSPSILGQSISHPKFLLMRYLFLIFLFLSLLMIQNHFILLYHIF